MKLKKAERFAAVQIILVIVIVAITLINSYDLNSNNRVVEDFDQYKTIVNINNNEYVVYDDYNNVLKEVRIHYGFKIKVLSDNDFNEDQKSEDGYKDKQKKNTFMVLRVLRFLVTGVAR